MVVWQWIITGLTVMAAAGAAVWRIARAISKGSKDCSRKGCGNCCGCPLKK